METSVKRVVEIKSKKIVSKVILFFLYRGINVANKVDDEVSKEIMSWKDGYIIKIQTCENGPTLILMKKENKIIRLKEEQNCNLEIIFKNLDTSFLLLTGRLGISKAYSEHRFLLKGNIMEAMSLVRCLDIVETYLFPKFMARNLVKEIKKVKIPKIIIYIRVLINY